MGTFFVGELEYRVRRVPYGFGHRELLLIPEVDYMVEVVCQVNGPILAGFIEDDLGSLFIYPHMDTSIHRQARTLSEAVEVLDDMLS